MSLMRTFLAASALLWTWTGNASAADLTDPQAIMDKACVMAYYQGADRKASVHMSIKDGQGRERVRDFVILRRDIGDVDNGPQQFYVYFDKPADVSRTVFMVWKHVNTGDDRWLYLPALDLVKRIAPSDERTSFVGSHFFYEEVSGRGNHEDTHKLVETTDTYYVMESTPKNPDEVEFSKFRAYIHKTTFLPVKIDYFNEAGTNYRTYEALKVDDINGRKTIVKARMTDKISGGATELTYSDVSYDTGLPEDIFTERYLRTPPRRYLR